MGRLVNCWFTAWVGGAALKTFEDAFSLGRSALILFVFHFVPLSSNGLADSDGEDSR